MSAQVCLLLVYYLIDPVAEAHMCLGTGVIRPHLILWALENLGIFTHNNNEEIILVISLNTLHIYNLNKGMNLSGLIRDIQYIGCLTASRISCNVIDFGFFFLSNTCRYLDNE